MSIPRSRDLRLLAGAAGISALGDFMAIFPLGAVPGCPYEPPAWTTGAAGGG